jgi:nucleotide-binding universal stress UspA family protein
VKLLVALDSTESDTIAVDAAATLAQAARATVVLLHVATTRSQSARVLARGLWDALHEIVEERQRDLAVHTMAFHGLPATVLVETLRFGEDLPRCIARVAEEQGADILVAGSRRIASLTGLLLGSVAEALIGQSSRPILLVRTRD